MNRKDLLRISYSKHKYAFLCMHLLNDSLQINHKFYKLAHLGNQQSSQRGWGRRLRMARGGWTATAALQSRVDRATGDGSYW